MNDAKTTIGELKEIVDQFKKDRNWGKHHTPKNLAVSITLEAAELLEHFQWDNLEKNDKGEIASELADIMIYCLHFANVSGVDIAGAIKCKLEHLSKKYPAELFRSGKIGAKEYWEIKAHYRAKKQ